MSSEALETNIEKTSKLDNISISDGTIEAIKWLAVLFMTIDHINSFLIYPITGTPYVEMFSVGRIAFPLFALVLAYNLARPRTEQAESKAIVNAMKRLFIFGLIATVPYYAATDGRTLPLNIMFTLAFATALIYCIRWSSQRQHWFLRYALYFIIHAVFAVGAALVEFSHYGVGLIIMAWLLFRHSSSIALIFTIVLTGSLFYINENLWALMALPIFALGYAVNIKMPRINKYAFYAYYPLHLAILPIIVLLYKHFA